MNICDIRFNVPINEDAKDIVFSMWDMNQNILKYRLMIKRIFEEDIVKENETKEENIAKGENNDKEKMEDDMMKDDTSNDDSDNYNIDRRYHENGRFSFEKYSNVKQHEQEKSDIEDEDMSALFDDHFGEEYHNRHKKNKRKSYNESLKKSARELSSIGINKSYAGIRRSRRLRDRELVASYRRDTEARREMEKTTTPVRLDLYYDGKKIGVVDDWANHFSVGRKIHAHELTWNKDTPDDIKLTISFA